MENVIELEQAKPTGTQLAHQQGGAIAEVPAGPMGMALKALSTGMSIEDLRGILQLQMDYEANEARKAYTVAMSNFKAEPINIFKKKEVGYKTKEGDFVGYSHAELSDVTDAIGPAMAKHNLSYRWSVAQTPGMVTVECIVTHSMGHSERISMSAPPDASGKKNAIQQIASAVTYMQRYTLLAITGMSTKGMDDDGAASGELKDEWVQRANSAQTAKELKEIFKQGTEVFNKAKDVLGYQKFATAVRVAGEALSKSAGVPQ